MTQRGRNWGLDPGQRRTAARCQWFVGQTDKSPDVEQSGADASRATNGRGDPLAHARRRRQRARLSSHLAYPERGPHADLHCQNPTVRLSAAQDLLLGHPAAGSASARGTVEALPIGFRGPAADPGRWEGKNEPASRVGAFFPRES